MLAPVIAVMASGVSCRFSLRFCAVTTISSSPWLASPEDWALAAPAASTAATVSETRDGVRIDMGNGLLPREMRGCRLSMAYLLRRQTLSQFVIC